LVADSIVRRTVLGCYRTTAGSRTHGGLTIAALENVRLCIAKIVFASADLRIASQERGA
jgi:hypothetical protein